ncbi:MAG: hypothetical protein HQL41_09625 [Alphaproteobacteria bacterium]|nr:hypothetical protein [Alphaproteobacteria bacterium]
METLSNPFVLGYHGCHRETAERVLGGGEHLRASSNDYDWLGVGVYFWEADPLRGLEWARERHGPHAAVIGAVIHLGHCLNLMSRHAFDALTRAYGLLDEDFRKLRKALPTNGVSGKSRKLDCAVIQRLHTLRQGHPPYDTVKGLFIEGREPFPGSAFRHQTHVQICVRQTRVIKGYFRVFEDHLGGSNTA